MNDSRPTKRPRGSPKGSKNTPRRDEPIMNQLSHFTIPQLVSALLPKIKSSDAETYIAESTGRSSSPASVVAEIKQLRTQLLHVETTLKVHQNSSRPINMLPPEILVAIFHELYPLPTRPRLPLSGRSLDDYHWSPQVSKLQRQAVPTRTIYGNPIRTL